MNISLLLDMAADGLGDRPAFGSASDVMTFTQLRERAQRAATELAGREPRPRTLAVADVNGPVTPIALFAAAFGGLMYAPLNYRLPGAALAELIRRLPDPYVVCGEAADTNLRPHGPLRVVTTQEWLGAGTSSAGSIFADDTEQPAVLLYTSGTSAAPKAAVLHHDHLCAYVMNTVEFGSADPEEATLLAVPPFHIAGVAGVLSACYAGRRVVPMAGFDALDWLRAARDERITHAFVVPTMLARIVAALEADAELRPAALRHVAYGGARMAEPVLERALRLLPDTAFVNAYGLTETSSTVAVLGPEEHRSAFAAPAGSLERRRLQSVGRAVQGVDIISVTEDGSPAGSERLGELRVRGDQVSGGYLDAADRVDADGWLHTGDLGWVDADGYVFIAGRGDDVIIRGGENIAPSEVEDALLRHPSVAAAAVAGLPDEEWGERIGAMVVLRPGVGTNGEELFRWARERLGSLKSPEVIVLRTELPLTDTGKLLRRHVRDELMRLDAPAPVRAARE